ncbi:uncharacterized protein [Clytia hemisphaerica]|uniref:uncharacterized protein n=1 Tax=Clytia hemisphaerica TaxID=252671 RepID=UPI0034D4CC2D
MSDSSETSSDERTTLRQNVAAKKNANKKFKPNKSFREVALQRALKTYVISNIVDSYNVLAIRVLWKEENYSDMFTRRQDLENIFKDIVPVKVLISCVTAMEKGEELDTGLSFWMAFDWPDITANKFENMLCKKVMESGVKIDSCKGVKPRGASIGQIENLAASQLYITLKDHKLAEPLKKIVLNKMRLARAEAINRGEDEDSIEIPVDESVKPVNIYVSSTIAKNVHDKLSTELPRLRQFNLDFELDMRNSSNKAPKEVAKPRSRLNQAIDVVARVMKDEKCELFKGYIYRHVPESTKTYYHYKPVEDYVMRILKNSSVADSLSGQTWDVIRHLEKPSCRIVKQMKMDYNYIEINDGFFFNIEKKCFEQNPALTGSPRAFVIYNHKKRPNPTPFMEGIMNSFPNPIIRKQFLQKYYQLLMHKKFPKKEKKLMLVGDSDSGKTSWFCPFEGIIPSTFISYIVPDGRFSASTIKSNTQIVCMDEWSPESLSCEDAKRLLQGGRITVQKKHKGVESFHYNSGFFITTNENPDFGPGRDGKAIKKRICEFDTIELPKVDTSMSNWLRKNCMEVFHWVALQLKDVPIFSCPIREKTKDGACYNDFDNENPFSSDDSDALEFSFTQPTAAEEVANAQPGPSRPSSSSSRSKTFEDVLDETYYMLENFDRYASNPDYQYREKVYKLLKEYREVRVPMPDEILKKYRQRYESDWQGADTVYDMFLLGKQKERSWFPYEIFEAEYPDYQSIIGAIIDERSTDRASTTDEDNEQQKKTAPKFQTQTRKLSKKKKRAVTDLDTSSDDDNVASKSTQGAPEKKKKTSDVCAPIKIEIQSSLSDTNSDSSNQTKGSKRTMKRYIPKNIVDEVVIISD